MNDVPSGDSDLSCETKRQGVDGGTRRRSPREVRDSSRNHEYFGERFGGREDRHFLNWQNSHNDNYRPSPTSAVAKSGRRCRTLTWDKMQVRFITLDGGAPGLAALEQELEVMRTELQGALLNLGIARKEQKANCKEASFVKAEYQSTKKKLLASREELTSLNEELAVLRGQIQETPWRRRTASEDRQNARHNHPGAKLFLPTGSDSLANDCHLEGHRNSSALISWRQTAANRIAGLTPRQREVMELVLAGHRTKNIAAHLCISQRTVENHRASIMKKTGSNSLPALTRLALSAAGGSALP